MPRVIMCKFCKKQFIFNPTTMRKERKYCSAKCFTDFKKADPNYKGYWFGKVRKDMIGNKFRKGLSPWNKGKPHMIGNLHPNWKGGRRKINKGYIYIYQPQHPFATKHKTILEHRLVMEKHIGKYLKPNEQVHHINRKKNDNRIENLILLQNNAEHKRIHKESERDYFREQIRKQKK